MIEQFVALSGLPRTGSTLLSSILSQNPKIYSEGPSSLCQMMWDMEWCCQKKSLEMLDSLDRPNITYNVVSTIPDSYYKGTLRPIVVDKCRTWTLPGNHKILHTYFKNPPKIIVLVRPIDEIVRSFMYVRYKNGWTQNLEQDLLTEKKHPIMVPLEGVEHAMNNNHGEFLFVTYNDLVVNTLGTINRIYEFCEWEPFEHYYTNIENPFPGKKQPWQGLSGLHDIRSDINFQFNDIQLSADAQAKCDDLNDKFSTLWN